MKEYGKEKQSQDLKRKETNALEKFLSSIGPSQEFIDNPQLFVDLLTDIPKFILNRLVVLSNKYDNVFMSQTSEAVWIGCWRETVTRACAVLKSFGLIDYEQRGWNTPCDYQLAPCFKNQAFIDKLLQALRNSLPKLQDAHITLYRTNESIKKNIRIGECDLSKDKSLGGAQKENEPTREEIVTAILDFKAHLASLDYNKKPRSTLSTVLG